MSKRFYHVTLYLAQAHLQSHTQDEINMANVSELNPLRTVVFDQQKKYSCKACDKKFASDTIFQVGRT